MYFELTFFDFPAAKNFKELLGADLSISETSSLPEMKQTYFWILMQKLTKNRTRVKISKLHIYQEGKIVITSTPTIRDTMQYLHFITIFWTLFSVCPLNIS